MSSHHEHFLLWFIHEEVLVILCHSLHIFWSYWSWRCFAVIWMYCKNRKRETWSDLDELMAFVHQELHWKKKSLQFLIFWLRVWCDAPPSLQKQEKRKKSHSNDFPNMMSLTSFSVVVGVSHRHRLQSHRSILRALNNTSVYLGKKNMPTTKLQEQLPVA